MSSIPLISIDTLEILIILAGAFALGFWGRSIFAKSLPSDTNKLKALEEQIENLNGRISSANRSIVDYVSRESELKRKIELLSEASAPELDVDALPKVDANLQAKIEMLEEENKLNQSNLELAAKIIEQLRDENERNRILPNHMESYMAALTEANSQVLLFKNQLEESQDKLAQAEQIICQLQDKLQTKQAEPAEPVA